MKFDALLKNKKIFFAGGIILAIFLPVFLADKTPAKICFKEFCFDVEAADTPAKRAEGLMFRENLPENSGMLFVFENEGIYPFWMKNTLIYLDIIWIDKNGKIVFIKENAQPCKSENCPEIMPPSAAKYVLEINAGQVEKLNFTLGQKIKIDF